MGVSIRLNVPGSYTLLIMGQKYNCSALFLTAVAIILHVGTDFKMAGTLLSLDLSSSIPFSASNSTTPSGALVPRTDGSRMSRDECCYSDGISSGISDFVIEYNRFFLRTDELANAHTTTLTVTRNEIPPPIPTAMKMLLLDLPMSVSLVNFITLQNRKMILDLVTILFIFEVSMSVHAVVSDTESGIVERISRRQSSDINFTTS